MSSPIEIIGQSDTFNEWVVQLAAMPDSTGDNPFCIAAKYGKIEILRELLARGFPISYKTNTNITPIFIAAQKGQKETVLFLLAAGADPFVSRNGGGDTFDIAIQNKNFDIVDSIINFYMNSDHNYWYNLLKKTSQLKYIEISNKIIDKIINNSDTQPKDIIYTCIKNRIINYESIKKLFDNGFTINKNSDVLNLAIDHSFDLETIKILIDKGANVNYIDSAGYTPLGLSIMNNASILETKLLIDNGADLYVDLDDTCCLFNAIILGHDSAKILIENRVSINHKYASGRTIVHHLIYHGDQSDIEKIMAYAPDINIQDSDGNTALHLAIICRPKIAFNLALLPFDLTIKNNEGYTPIDLATNHNFKKMIEFFNTKIVNVFNVQKTCIICRKISALGRKIRLPVTIPCMICAHDTDEIVALECTHGVTCRNCFFAMK